MSICKVTSLIMLSACRTTTTWSRSLTNSGKPDASSSSPDGKAEETEIPGIQLSSTGYEQPTQQQFFISIHDEQQKPRGPSEETQKPEHEGRSSCTAQLSVDVTLLLHKQPSATRRHDERGHHVPRHEQEPTEEMAAGQMHFSHIEAQRICCPYLQPLEHCTMLQSVLRALSRLQSINNHSRAKENQSGRADDTGRGQGEQLTEEARNTCLGNRHLPPLWRLHAGRGDRMLTSLQQARTVRLIRIKRRYVRSVQTSGVLQANGGSATQHH